MLWEFVSMSYVANSHATMSHTHLPRDALHHDPGHRGDGSPLCVVERALRVVQAGQRSDLLLRNGGLVWRLQGGETKL